MGSRAEVGWLFANPGEEALDVGMSGEGFEGIVFTFQSFFAEQSVQVIMAGGTKPGDALFDFFAFKFPFVAFVRVSGARDQVMAGEQ